MNRKQKIKQLKKFINKYGIIKTEYKRPKSEEYTKESYYAEFDSKKLGIFCSIGDVDKYHVYKTIVKDIKEYNPYIYHNG